MEHVRSDGEINAKRLKPNEEEGNNRDQMPVANIGGNTADANDALSPRIFKLDIDCCEEIFAYLSLEDLYSLGQTCKRMHRFTGYVVRENYKSTKFEWKKWNLYFDGKIMNGFIEFISYLRIGINQLEGFAQFAPRFMSVRKLYLGLNTDQIDCIKEILQNCEEIEINFGRNISTIDLYEKILKFCTNIKYFSLNQVFNSYVLENNNWLHHEYPNLEYLDLYSRSNVLVSNAAIRTFFTLNKGIRKFQTNMWCLWNFRHWIVDSDIKLDKLLIGCRCSAIILKRKHIDLLNTLYERGFYKHLSLLGIQYYETSVLAEICAPLKMELMSCDSPIPLLDLKELELDYLNIGDLETILANNVSTIERIHVRGYLSSENVLFLVGKFMKLKELEIMRLNDVNGLNLAQLNEERNKLVGATNVTIYLNKRDYDETIKTTDFGLVKIKKM